MIKISYIIGRLSYGGAEKLLLDICRKIDKSKFEVEVLVLQENNPLAEEFEKQGINLKFFHKKKKLDFRVIKNMAEYLQRSKPDIVHTHLFAGDYWGGKAAIKANITNIISTKHDILLESFWRSRFGRMMRRKFTWVVAISKATRDYLIGQEKIDVDKVTVIYNGIDVNKFYVEKPALFAEEKLVIGSIGRLSKEKGHKHLIRACRFLKNKNWELVFVGEGPLRKDLEVLTGTLGLESQVKFVGEKNDVRPYLNTFDVFVLPSISEGLSLVVLEAAASGRMIVATNVGGVPEIIQDQETGLLFKPKNIEQLVKKLNWISEHHDLAIKMAKNLQQSVVDKYDINQTVKQYEKLYESTFNK